MVALGKFHPPPTPPPPPPQPPLGGENALLLARLPVGVWHSEGEWQVGIDYMSYPFLKVFDRLSSVEFLTVAPPFDESFSF